MPDDAHDPPVVSVDHARLLRRLRRLAQIGARAEGGINRQAFSEGDIQARHLMLEWADEIGLDPFTDAFGNLFLRLSAGANDDGATILSGSHLDTQPAGGWLDGAYGVVAALEALNAIKESGVALVRPLEAVAWVNEEGSRFHPGLMGASGFAGKLDLSPYLVQQDDAGVTLETAMKDLIGSSPAVPVRHAPPRVGSVVEAHIEQGPILEAEGASIGVVEGVQGLYWLQVTVTGEAGHAGTAPVSRRRDAVQAAVRMIHAISVALHDPEDVTRLTIGRIVVSPNSPNTIADHVRFTIDLRHPDELELERCLARIRTICRDQVGPCEHQIEVTEHLQPVVFDPSIADSVAAAARAHGFGSRRLVSGASHDTAVLASRYPAGMIFIPCIRGVSHHPAEDATEDSLAAGADVLATVLAGLASGD